MAKQLATQITEFSQAVAMHEKTFHLPAHVERKKFMRTIVGAVQNNPAILKCDRASIFAACQKAALDGLILDGREAALVPFKTACTYMPMVAGILKKMRNSGQVSTIKAERVCKNDPFSYNPAMDDVPNHSPDWFGGRGETIGVYAVAKMKDGGTVVEIMNLAQIEKVRKVSRSSNAGPWKDWFDEMALKSVLRRIARYLPSSADLDQVFDHDNANYDLDSEDVTDVEPAPAPPKKKAGRTRAAAVIEGEAEAVPDDPPAETVDTETGEIIPPPAEDDAPRPGDLI